jgi:hypothetical protein
MSKHPHHQQGAESMGGGNSGRRTGAEPRLQSGAGIGKEEKHGGAQKERLAAAAQGSMTAEQSFC